MKDYMKINSKCSKTSWKVKSGKHGTQWQSLGQAGLRKRKTKQEEGIYD